MNTEPRKKFHMINRLRKAQKEADKLEKLVMASEQVRSPSTVVPTSFLIF